MPYAVHFTNDFTELICIEVLKVFDCSLPSGQDLQSEVCVPGALSNATNEPFGHFLQLVLT